MTCTARENDGHKHHSNDLLVYFPGSLQWCSLTGAKRDGSTVSSTTNCCFRLTAPAFRIASLHFFFLNYSKATRTNVGLDGYMLLRFIRMCQRMTLFASLIGVTVLIPFYSTGDGGFHGFNALTLNNVTSPTSMWLSAMLMVLCSVHAMYLIGSEYKHYVAWRMEYLMEGSPSRPYFQSRYTVMIEGLPSELKTNAALERYFERIFPGQVHSANIQLDISSLERLHERRLVIVDALERAVAYEHVTGGIKYMNLTNGPYSSCFGGVEVRSVPYLRKELSRLNEEAGAIQMRVHAEQRTERMNENSSPDSASSGGFRSMTSQMRVPVEQQCETTNLLQGCEVGSDDEIAVEGAELQRSVNATACALLIHLGNSAAHQTVQMLKMLQEFVWCVVLGSVEVLGGAGGAVVDSISAKSAEHSEAILKSDTAFVTFTSSSAVKAVCSVSLTTRSNMLKVSLAPDAKDIIWKNVSISRSSRAARWWLATFAYIVVVCVCVFFFVFFLDIY